MKKKAQPATKGKAAQPPAPDPVRPSFLFRHDAKHRAILEALQKRWNRTTMNGTLLHLVEDYARLEARAAQDHIILVQLERDLAELATQVKVRDKASAQVGDLTLRITRQLPLVRPLNRQIEIE